MKNEYCAKTPRGVLRNITKNCCKHCEYIEKCSNDVPCEFRICKEALKKQIPRKPIDNRRCPNCNESVYYYDDEYEYEVKNEWCQNCGQHILWDKE